ncbi:MAG: OmpA family protein [Rhodospirillales bacterium]|nr:OmpA family protein [Rhodospirillales bacterium]
MNRRTAFTGALTAFSLILTSSGIAAAQQETYVDFSDPNVTVDLSVIDNGGYQSVTGAAATVFGGSANLKLLIPGRQAPTSMLHIPTVSGKPLTLPKKQKAIQTAAEIPAPAIKESPAPKPKPAVIAATPKKLEAPAKPTMPAPVAQVAPVAKVAKVAKSEAPKAPAPPPAPKKEVTAAPQQAALPTAIEPGQALRVTFGGDQTKLPAAAKNDLLALAEKMKGQGNMRLQLMAYAGGPSLSSSLARRMSLSRALSIRSFLIESGVRSTRIDVRALGNKTTEEPVNRVDLNVTER